MPKSRKVKELIIETKHNFIKILVPIKNLYNH